MVVKFCAQMTTFHFVFVFYEKHINAILYQPLLDITTVTVKIWRHKRKYLAPNDKLFLYDGISSTCSDFQIMIGSILSTFPSIRMNIGYKQISSIYRLADNLFDAKFTPVRKYTLAGFFSGQHLNLKIPTNYLFVKVGGFDFWTV